MAVRPTKIVRLTDEVDAESWVVDRTFEGALILGPAVVTLEEAELVRCAFTGPADSMLIEIPAGKRVQGIVGLRNVTFKDCLFQDIAFLGTAAALENLRVAMVPQTQANPIQVPPAPEPEPVPAQG